LLFLFQRIFFSPYASCLVTNTKTGKFSVLLSRPKHTTEIIIMRREGEIVLIYREDKPAAFGRIEAIEFDVKKDWYQITLLLLTIPTQTVTWILRESYIDGAPFTMGGRPMRLETVQKTPVRNEPEGTGRVERTKANDKPGKVIPFKKK
jgi:hypothetical protein